jgi:hypothetical protein
MPTPAVPTISQIYAAFSPESYSIFRTAMGYSRGGVVRVADLLAALRERLPDAAEPLRDWRRPLASGEVLLPMTNEPALREALAQAYALANGGALTPAHLLHAALATLRPITLNLRPAQSVVSPERVRPTQPAQGATAEAVEALLAQWLALQEAPEPECRAELNRLAVRVSSLASGVAASARGE